MSQARSKKPEKPPRDVRPYWIERGYRPDVASLQPGVNDDPKGEEAYQRAFVEAAKADPPRLPNPQWYPNSASAQEYIRKRNTDFLQPRGAKRPGDDQPGVHQQNVRKIRDPDRSPLLPSMKQSDAGSTKNFIPGPRLPGIPAGPAAWNPDNLATSPLSLPTPTQLSQQPFAVPRLGVLEPTSGPSGPVNKLR